jgi:hypothetical protein
MTTLGVLVEALGAVAADVEVETPALWLSYVARNSLSDARTLRGVSTSLVGFATAADTCECFAWWVAAGEARSTTAACRVFEKFVGSIEVRFTLRSWR